LFDIRLVLARAVAFVIFIFLCAGIYTGLLFIVTQEIFNVKIDFLIAGSALVIAIFGALSFQPILRLLQKVTNAIFYKGHYDREKLLSELTHSMTQTIELENMTTTILNLLTKEMRLSEGAFLMMEKNKKYCQN
jgi:hypothetical protein